VHHETVSPKEFTATETVHEVFETTARKTAPLTQAQIAGCIGAYLFRSVGTDSYVEINGLVVDQNVRSSGIGKMLIDAAEEWARRVRCHAVSVRSNIKRDRAHRFYTINGYDHVKTQKEFRKSL
jgi:GNAT superfamily N-acetyltransferase